MCYENFVVCLPNKYTMKISFFALFLTLLFYTNLIAQKSIAEQLGYASDAKLLIIHADDLGVSHSENMASIKAMEDGSVNSASIMVPCPWFPEIANYAKEHPEMDFGLHLTVTSEWKNYKWGPSYGPHNTSSFINDKGYFYDGVADVVANGNAEVLQSELRAQVKKALNAGIDVTHLDSHMGAVMATPEFLEAYIKTGREFQLPVLLGYGIPAMQSENIKSLLTAKDVVVDALFTAMPTDFKDGMEQFYSSTLNNLQPGLSILLIHTAYDDNEMQAITIDHPDWGAAWRQADFDFFTSEKCKSLIEANNIKLVTWKEIRDKITRG